MPTNFAITGALVPGIVPPDLECALPQTTLNAVCALSQVVITQAGQQGNNGNSIADQALNVANTALALAQQVQASIPQRRANSTPQSIPSGDSNLSITWAPDLPDANYEVNGTFYGPAGAGAFPGTFYVVDNTRTVSGCTLRLCNAPANFSFAWSVTDLGA